VNRKYVQAVLLVILALLAIAGCGRVPLEQAAPPEGQAAPENQAAATEEPAEEAPAGEQEAVGGEPQVVTRAITSEPGSLDPQGPAGAGQNAILPYLFDTLVYLDIDNKFHPYLAESWETSPDGLAVTFNLRENVTFHDGTPLNAEAVRYTFERLKQQGQASVLAGMAEMVESIDVIDETTVRFNLSEPSSTLLSSLATPYAGIISPTAAEERGRGFGQSPVGSGAYMLEKWDPGVSITLVKNPDYAWAPDVVENQAAPHIDRLVFSILPDVSQQVAAFEAGEVDILFVNQPSHVERLRQNPDAELVETTLNSLIYLGFNLSRPPFDDLRVRQAFSHAVNKEEILETALGGIGQVAVSPLAATLPGFDPSVEAYALDYDPERTAALLAEAGFTQGPDGTWAADGVPLEVTLLTSTRPPNQAIATVLQSQYKAVGIPVEIQTLDSGAAMDAATAGNYDLLLWRYDWNDADVLRVYLSTSRIGRTNRNFYSNPELDRILDEAARELDDERRNELYLEAQQIILTDAPWQPLYTPQDYIAVRKDVTSIVMGPMGHMLMNDAVKQ